MNIINVAGIPFDVTIFEQVQQRKDYEDSMLEEEKLKRENEEEF